MAVRRLEFVSTQLRDLGAAAGMPGDSTMLLEVVRRTPPHEVIQIGTRVELYSAFNRTWAAGFKIANAVSGGYRVRRDSDGSLLPGHTSPIDVRVDRDHGVKT